MEASSCALVVAGVLLLASTVQITGGAAIPPSITPAATSTTPTAATNSTVTSNNTNSSAADAPTSVPGQQRADSGSQFLEAILDIYFGSRNKLTNTHSLRGHESNTQANTHVDVCSVQVIGLAAGPAVHGPTHGSSPRHRIQLNMSPLPALQPSCRVQLSAPPSNYLRIELIPSPDTLSSEEVDDAFDGERAMGFAAAMWGVDKESEDEGGDSADLFARRESRPTNSCTLAMLEDGKVAWSMNLCDVEDVQASKHHLDNVPHNVTLVWTPPPPGVGVRFPALTVTAVRKGVASDNLCSVRAVRLAGVGLESAMVLELRDDRPTDQRGSPCRASVATPPSHRLSFLLLNEGQAVEADSEAEPEDDAAPAKPSCVLSVLHGCASELWSGDLCDPTVKSSLNFTELFPNNVTLEWTAPVQRSAQLATTVLLTAVGKGKVCASRQFVPCWRRPRSQPLCVASELACDGYNNCPMDGDDEEPVLCRPNSKLTDVLGQTPTSSSPVTPAYPPDGKREFLGAIFDIYNKNRNRVANTHSSRGHDTNIHGDTSPDTLSSHGIWGYLMLTMLVCGAFLMLCGLWECCCKQPKAAPTAPSHTPTTVLMPQMGATGGVLVLDSDLDDDPSRPPAYEDLDQPPSYGVLFPPGLLAGQPKDDVEAVPAQTIDSVPPELLAEDFADADDVPSIRSSSSASVASSSISLAPS